MTELSDYKRLVSEPHERQLRATIARMEVENGRLRRCLLPIHMGLAEAELSGEPVGDSVVVLSFMGSGASDQVTAGEVRAALAREAPPSPTSPQTTPLSAAAGEAPGGQENQ
jgi:hypothetical protein